MKESKTISVLFVCMGNICRSPTAEGVFRSIVEKNNTNGLEIFIDSAGTHAYHIGNPPDSRAQSTAHNHGIDLSKLVARKVTIQDFIEFDYIVAMDNDNILNLKDIQSKADLDSRASVYLFMEFAKNWQNDEVPDPYYGGDKGFEEVYRMVTDASLGLLERIEEQS